MVLSMAYVSFSGSGVWITIGPGVVIGYSYSLESILEDEPADGPKHTEAEWHSVCRCAPGQVTTLTVHPAKIGEGTFTHGIPL